eukprot:6583800-Pyramimonas_sp.AAC.1
MRPPREYTVTAAAKRAAVVKEDDLPAKADIQPNPVTASTALLIELKTRLTTVASRCKMRQRRPTSRRRD